MKKIISLFFALLLVGSMVACGGNKPAETTDAGTAAAATPYDGPIFYVSPDGQGNGSEETPFAGLDQALARIHELRDGGSTAQYTVNLLPGEYAVTSFTFDAALGGTAEEPTVIQGIGDGEVILSAGKNISAASFKPVDNEEMKARFFPEAAGKILVCDLAAEGVTADMIGKQLGYGYGSPMPAEDKGTNVGFFWNDTRMTNARYPNDSGKFLYEDQAHIEEGGILDASTGTIRLSDDMAAHISRWKTLEGALVHDYFMYNWSEETTPISAYDAETQAMTVTYPTSYKEGAEYYFFNVPEELDAPGEYYVDRENLMLYVYPLDDNADSTVMLNYYRAPMFTGDFSNVLFKNITCQGSCATLFAPTTAEGLQIRECVLRNCEDGAFYSSAAKYNNVVYGCEIYNLGCGSVNMNGSGDYDTLTHSNNRIENNKVHDCAQITRMYTGGIGGNGVGIVTTHNEIWNLPHSAVGEGGLENTIEWNYIHDVVQEADDAGAFYGGGQWHSFGNVISHNKFERVGNDTRHANGIYLDDMLSGFTVQYNVLIDVYGYAFMIGGGRSNTVTNNIVINHGIGSYFYYDQRMRDNYLAGHPAFLNQDTGMWAELNRYPQRTSELWASKYPQLAAITFDTSDIDNPDFPINPAYSVVKNNIYVGRAIDKWNLIVWDTVPKYSEIGEYLYSAEESRVFEEGSYELTKIGKRSKIEYEVVPFEGYGTYAD